MIDILIYWGQIIGSSFLAIWLNLDKIVGYSGVVIVLVLLVSLVSDLVKYRIAGFKKWWTWIKGIYKKKLEDRLTRNTVAAICLYVAWIFFNQFYSEPYFQVQNARRTMTAQAGEITSGVATQTEQIAIRGTEIAAITQQVFMTLQAVTGTPTSTLTTEDEMKSIVQVFFDFLSLDDIDSAIDMGTINFQQTFQTEGNIDRQNFYLEWKDRDSIEVLTFSRISAYGEEMSLYVEVLIERQREDRQPDIEHKEFKLVFIRHPETGRLEIDQFTFTRNIN